MDILNKTAESLAKDDQRTLLDLANKLFADSDSLKTMVNADSTKSLSKTFSDKEVIADKAVDIFVNAAIALMKIGLDSGEIDNLIRSKLTDLTGTIHSTDQKYPFEIHITVEIPKNSSFDEYLHKFVEACSMAKVKPIMLDLQNQSSKHVMNDATTSSKFFGTEEEAKAEVERICKILSESNFNVIRKKIETAIWHEKAQKKELSPGEYFECHVGLMIPTDNIEDRMTKLSEICKKHSAHLSRNTMKNSDNGQLIQMATIRTYESPDKEHVSNRKYFENEIESFAKDLTDNGYEYEKLVYEFALYDTKNSHDKEWLDSSKQL